MCLFLHHLSFSTLSLWTLCSPGSDRHGSDFVWCSIPWPRTEGSPWSRWRCPATDPAYRCPTLDSRVRSYLQPARWHAEPDQTRRPERGLPQVAHWGLARMTTAFWVCVSESECMYVSVSSWHGKTQLFVCGLMRVRVCSDAKTKQQLTTTAVTDTQCFTWLHDTWTDFIPLLFLSIFGPSVCRFFVCQCKHITVFSQLASLSDKPEADSITKRCGICGT